MCDAFLRASDEEVSLPLGERDHDVDDHLVGGLGRIERGLKYTNIDVALCEVGNGRHGLPQRAPKAVEAGHDEGVTRPHVRERSIEARTLPFAAQRSIREEARGSQPTSGGHHTGRLENHPNELSRHGRTNAHRDLLRSCDG